MLGSMMAAFEQTLAGYCMCVITECTYARKYVHRTRKVSWTDVQTDRPDPVIRQDPVRTVSTGGTLEAE